MGEACENHAAVNWYKEKKQYLIGSTIIVDNSGLGDFPALKLPCGVAVWAFGGEWLAEAGAGDTGCGKCMMVGWCVVGAGHVRVSLLV